MVLIKIAPRTHCYLVEIYPFPLKNLATIPSPFAHNQFIGLEQASLAPCLSKKTPFEFHVYKSLVLFLIVSQRIKEGKFPQEPLLSNYDQKPSVSRKLSLIEEGRMKRNKLPS